MDVSANGKVQRPQNATGGRKRPIKRVVNIPQPSRAKPQKSKRRGFRTWLVSNAVRVSVWYIIITMLFRCPGSLDTLDDASPAVCRPFLTLQSRSRPYVEPYYTTHLAPYIAKAQPYVERFNGRIYTPAADLAARSYRRYAAPRVTHAQQYALAGWQKTLKPQIQHAQAQARAQYNATLAPHVQRISVVTSPYYTRASSAVGATYDNGLKPAYRAVLPHAQTAFEHAHHYALDVGYPFARRGASSAGSFLLRHVWPQLRILYGDSVEPQLMRIKERLGRYENGRRLDAFVNSVDRSSLGTYSSSISSVSSVAASAMSTSSDTPSAGSSVESHATTDSETENVQERIANDLRTWQNRLAKAAEKGAEELAERVEEITNREFMSQADDVGDACLVDLEKTIEDQLRTLDSSITAAVRALPEDASEDEINTSYRNLIRVVDAAGIAIQRQVEAVRSWRRQYDRHMSDVISLATESTLEVIDHIRDLGLQEMGMRWAGMEGVSYDDWSMHHSLKKTFDPWRHRVQDVAFQHQHVNDAKKKGLDIEDMATTMAQRAYDDLFRLSNIAWRRLHTHDGSVKFDLSALAEAENIVAEHVAAEISEPSSISVDAAQRGLSAAKSMASEVSSTLSAVSSTASSVGADSTQSVKKVWGGVMAQVIVEAKQIVFEDEIDDADDDGDDDDDTFSAKIQSMVDEAGDRAAELTRAISEALLKPTSTQGSLESATSLASEQYARAMAAASSVLYGPEQGSADKIASLASDRYAQAVTAASYAIYGTQAPAIESLRARASSQYDSAIQIAREQYDEAKSAISAKVTGSPKPAHEEALSSVREIYSSSLSAASARLQNVLGHPNTAGPTQGAWESVSSVASHKLHEGLSAASAQFSSAKLTVETHPTPINRQYIAEAQRRYYQGIGLAHARYSEFLESASIAAHGTPTPAYEEYLAAAGSQYNAAVAAAATRLQDVLSSASSLAGHTSKQPAQTALASASSIYDAAVSEAALSFSAASMRASSLVYGTSTGAFESVTSQAAENWDSLIAKASEQVYGAPTPWVESTYLQAGLYGAQATEAAVAQYAAVQSLLSELVVGKEPDFTESVMSRFSSAYYTMASSASSYANEAYESASSVVSSVFTPPTALEDILESANAQVNAAVDAISMQLYGTEKHGYEKATDAAASAYSSASSMASEAVYGAQSGYGEAAQSSLADVASSAQSAISVAIYGTPTGRVEAATASAASIYSSLSDAMYGPQQGALESATSRLHEVVESAQARIRGLAVGAGDSANERYAEAEHIVAKTRDEL